MLLAHYKCLRCGHEWHIEPEMTSCFKCNPQLLVDVNAKPEYKYVKWVNYEEMAKRK